MSIIAKNKGGDFTPAPAGVWPAVCVDVVDKGMVESAMYKPRHMVQLRWVLEAEPALPDGRPHMAVRQFGLSLGEQSHLRPFLEAWRGKKFTDDELAGFDLEKLIAAPCQLQIIHSTKNGVTYGNVQAAFPLGKTSPRMEIPKDYVRAQDRPDYKPPFEETVPATPNATYEDNYSTEIDDSDVPF
jgi:hypothetical protein